MPSNGAHFAVADIGSNTVKLTVYTCDERHLPTVVHHESDTVRIGHGISATGRISTDRTQRLIASLQRLSQVARAHDATQLMAVATEAFRQASNGTEVRNAIRDQTNWYIEIITGDDEARLTMESARPFIDAGSHTVIADIGGASTELVVVTEDGSLECGRSVPVGSGALFDEHINSSPPPPGSIAAATNAARTQLSTTALLPLHTDALLLPGGSGNLLRKLLLSIDANATFDRQGLTLLHDWLATNDGSMTASRLNIQLERAHVLPASLAIAEALDSLLEPTKIRAIPSGVGLGLANQVCSCQDSP